MIGVGLDVGAARVHAVALDASSRAVVDAAVVEADPDGGDGADAVVAWLRSVGGVARVAIDAPSGRSTLAHAHDGALAPKFRMARCGEVALGRDGGVWVPWVSPAVGAAEVPGWMDVGISLFSALAAAGVEAVETFPHAVFRVLSGGERVAAKSTVAGIAQRAALLTEVALVREPSLPLWSHDGLDAAAAAVVAVDRSPQVLTCGHDGSSIWLPSEP